MLDFRLTPDSLLAQQAPVAAVHGSDHDCQRVSSESVLHSLHQAGPMMQARCPQIGANHTGCHFASPRVTQVFFRCMQTDSVTENLIEDLF